MFATPKLLDALALALEDRGTNLQEVGITGIFSGGTEFTPQWTRYAVEELLGGPPEEGGIYMTPTYGNTLMGLACSRPVTAAEKYKITYYAPQPRPQPGRALRSNGSCQADDLDQGVLRTGVPGTRRGRA